MFAKRMEANNNHGVILNISNETIKKPAGGLETFALIE